MKDVVVLEIYRKNSLVERREIETCEWYDGDIEAIDSNEYRMKNGIESISGTEYDFDGNIDKKWRNYYDELGRLTKSEEY